MTYSCIPDALSHAYYRYGKFVARHPLPFLLVPPLIALLLMIGLINVEPTSDAEYLYVPVNARSLGEREHIETTFLHDDRQYFTSLRFTSNVGFLQVHIEPRRNGSNALRDDVIDAAKRLDSFIQDHAVSYDGSRYRYSDLCARWNDTCSSNALLDIVGNQSINDLSITYPFHRDARGAGIVSLVQSVGGVDYSASGVLTSARALQLSYFVKSQLSSDEKRSNEWLNSLRDELFDYEDDAINIDFQTSLSLDQVTRWRLSYRCL